MEKWFGFLFVLCLKENMYGFNLLFWCIVDEYNNIFFKSVYLLFYYVLVN